MLLSALVSFAKMWRKKQTTVFLHVLLTWLTDVEALSMKLTPQPNLLYLSGYILKSIYSSLKGCT